MEKEIDKCSKCNNEKSKAYAGWRNVTKSKPYSGWRYFTKTGMIYKFR